MGTLLITRLIEFGKEKGLRFVGEGMIGFTYAKGDGNFFSYEKKDVLKDGETLVEVHIQEWANKTKGISSAEVIVTDDDIKPRNSLEEEVQSILCSAYSCRPENFTIYCMNDKSTL